jgi:hypothetical protein
MITTVSFINHVVWGRIMYSVSAALESEFCFDMASRISAQSLPISGLPLYSIHFFVDAMCFL